MHRTTDPEQIERALTRGVAEVVVEEQLRAKLTSGRKLRIKLGIDPTSPHLHIGRSIPLLKLRDFQELGHQVVFLVGDFTGTIGDTSDKESERPMLDRETVEENMQTYVDQAAQILDMSRVEVRYNSEWLAGLRYGEISEHANLFSVADFISRENIRRRLDAGSRVSLRELLYPLMQGYDSVVLRADVEIGGMDQRFNILAARPIQTHYGQEPQDAVFNPLILGLDGRKMSSSWGNTIPLTASPDDMYGRTMRVLDSEIIPYFTLCTRVPQEEVDTYERMLAEDANPRDIKMKLAHALVSLHHSPDAADAAARAFTETFQEGSVPEEVPEVTCGAGESGADALVRAGFFASRNELRRLLEQGGVRDAHTGAKVTELSDVPANPRTLKLGKRRFVKLL